MTKFEPAPLPPATVEADGKLYMRDAQGGLRPIELVKATDQLEDETVRKIMGHMVALSEQISRFKGHTFEDIGALDEVLAQEHGAKLGGRKGNKTLMSFDGLNKIEVRVADQIDFGPELQIAKQLVDECLNEWAADARAEIRALVTKAFNTDKEGLINRSDIFTLLRLDITDPRWVRAMDAIRSAIRVVGSKTYVRGARRAAVDAPWENVTVDLAKA